MNKIKLQVLTTLLVGIFLSPLSLADAVGGSIGMHGIAVNYQKAFSDYLNARFVFSDMPLERDIEEDDIEYEVEYDRTNLGALLDYHPLAGSFHITGGIYTGDHNWTMEASASDGDYDIGDNTYSAENLNLKSQVSFAKSAPYLGIGWGNTIGGTGITTNLDLGVLYVGQPSVSLKASGTIDGIDATSFPEFQENLEKERSNLEEDLEDFTYMPVIQFGLAFKF